MAMTRQTIRTTWVILLLICVAVTGAATQQQPAAASNGQIGSSGDVRQPDIARIPEPQLQTRYPRYQLRPGDSVDLVFSFAADFNQTATVQPDGYIMLRELGDVYVLGKTIPELTLLVKTAYERILQQPVVTVVLKDFEKPHFVVAGEVAKPGKYDLRADTTATEAVAIAGGFSDKAKHSQVLLFRRVSDDWVEVKKLDVKRLYKGDFREDVHLRPGDMLFVPQNRISKVKPFLPTWAVGAYVNPVGR